MKASFIKRLIAYIIDIIIFSLIFEIFTMIIPDNNNIAVLNQQLSNLSESVLNDQLSLSAYFYQYSSIVHSIDKELFLSNLFNFILMIGYFVMLPFYYNGQTLGKKLLKIKIIKEQDDLSINDLLLRNCVINGLLYSLICFALVFLASDLTYLIIISILGFIQILLVIISVFMILYRKDKKGLHDLWCKTSVVEENYEVEK